MELKPTAPTRIERAAAWVIVLAGVIFCLTYFSTLLQPIVVAVMIWYCVFELRRFLQKAKVKGRTLPTGLANLFAFGIIFLVGWGFFEIIIINLEMIIKKSPSYAANFQAMVNELQTIRQFNEVQERVLGRLEAIDLQPLLTRILNSLTSVAGNVFVIIIYVAFMLVEEKFFYRKLHALSDTADKQGNLDRVMDQMVKSIRQYMSVKTQMSLLTAVLSYFILLAFGVDFAVLWAFLIFVLNYIPYIGSFLATLLPAAFAMFQFQSGWMLAWVFLAIQVVQFGIGNVLEPKIMGRQLNLSPLGVMLALTFWGAIWGVLGMFLSVPITSVMVISFSRFESTRFIAVWLSETGDPG
jgi:AI-2 transport protein TqsA